MPATPRMQLAGAFAVELTSGPTLFDSISLGRLDAAGPDPPANLPSPSETQDQLCSQWTSNNYTNTELVRNPPLVFSTSSTIMLEGHYRAQA